MQGFTVYPVHVRVRRWVASGLLIGVTVASGHAVASAQSLDAMLTGRLYDHQAWYRPFCDGIRRGVQHHESR
jgi:hypothetical protein